MVKINQSPDFQLISTWFHYTTSYMTRIMINISKHPRFWYMLIYLSPIPAVWEGLLHHKARMVRQWKMIHLIGHIKLLVTKYRCNAKIKQMTQRVLDSHLKFSWVSNCGFACRINVHTGIPNSVLKFWFPENCVKQLIYRFAFLIQNTKKPKNKLMVISSLAYSVSSVSQYQLLEITRFE